MNKFEFLKDISIKHLESLYEVTTDQTLKDNIENVLKNSRQYMAEYYSSDRYSYIDESLSQAYLKLIDNLLLEDLDFYTDLVCLSRGNNRGANANYNFLDKPILMYYYPGVREALFKYDIRFMKQFHNIFFFGSRYYEGKKDESLVQEIKCIPEVIEAEEKTQYFKYLEEFFNNEENRYYYEGSYNSYMYIKDSLYKILSNHSTNISDILKETQEKSILVLKYLQEICRYLYELKESVSDCRISACNNRHIIQVIKGKQDPRLNKKQLTELLALGITKYELDKLDFSPLERLIYIPRNKPRKTLF